MPIYDYHCTACEKDFEIFMKPWEPVECPLCKCKAVNKKPCVAAGHVWKGSTEGVGPKRPWHGKPHSGGHET